MRKLNLVLVNIGMMLLLPVALSQTTGGQPVTSATTEQGKVMVQQGQEMIRQGQIMIENGQKMIQQGGTGTVTLSPSGVEAPAVQTTTTTIQTTPLPDTDQSKSTNPADIIKSGAEYIQKGQKYIQQGQQIIKSPKSIIQGTK